MKPHAHFHRANKNRRRGITLIECLVYIGCLGIVFGMGLTAFYECLENTASLRRNSEDITQALTIGELWRADVRGATQPVHFDTATQTLRINRGGTEISYKFAEGQVFRRTRADAPWVVVLPRVEQSRMTPDVRSQITAWRWELELHSVRQPVLLRPLFTFIAATTSS